MIANQITTHVQQALARLIQQYKGLTYFEGLITAFVNQVQDLENAIYPLDQYRQLQYAYGQQLDGLGELIGLARNGLQDSQYFVLLLGEIAQNNSDTTQPTLLNIVRTVFQASTVFVKTPNSPGSGPGGQEPPATISFGIGNPQTGASLYTIVEQIIQNSVAAGVNIVYLSTFNAQYAFSTAGSQAWCGGCSDLNNPQATDPQIATLIYNNPSQ